MILHPARIVTLVSGLTVWIRPPARFDHEVGGQKLGDDARDGRPRQSGVARDAGAAQLTLIINCLQDKAGIVVLGLLTCGFLHNHLTSLT